jgi:3-oxoacyl-[acyl-carrier-protein] synthase III
LGIPGKHFITKDMKEYFHEVIGVDPMKYLTYSSIEDFGYCGGATMLIQLDRLARASVLGKGDIVAAYLEESSKWMSGGFIVSQH